MQLISLVVGNGFTKTWSEVKQVVFPSVVATEQAGINFDGFKSGNDFVISYDGKRFAIGETAWKLGRIRTTQMDRSRVGSPFYKTLIAAALTETFRESGEISIILTMPISWYDKRDEIKEKLKGEYVVTRNKKTYTFVANKKDIRVVPEGFGVLASQLLDQDGCIANRQISKMKIGVVEIGTGTTDLSMFDQLELVPVKSKGIPIGLSDVWEGVRAEILDKHGRELELHEVDAAIRAGAFKDAGTVIDIRPFIKLHMPTLAESLAGEINNLWGENARELDSVLFAGGGTPQTYSYFNYSHGYKVDNSHTADAMGAYLYGKLKNRQGK